MQRILVVLLVGVCLFASATAQEHEEIVDLGPDTARISRVTPGAGLAPLAGASREESVAAFLRQRHGHDEPTADSLTATAADPSEQRVHLRFRQRVAGLDVYGTYVKATLTAAGEVVSVIENLAPVRANLQSARIDYRDALEAALERHHPGERRNLREVSSSENTVTYARGAGFYQNPTVTRVAVPMRGNRLRVGYVVETWDRENRLWHTVVSGLGRVLHEELRTAGENYRVFFPSPRSGPAFVFRGPSTGSSISPAGWTFANTTTGNNVDAYTDSDGDGVPDVNGRPIADAKGDFLATADLSQPPSTAGNKVASVTNLFVATNILHDFLYIFGFNEANGNFQKDNFGLGGAGNDAVRVEAQDGSGRNNANFATPPDGTAPRMQMYLWTTSQGDRDGGLDADLIIHEYGHGVTWRMIGGMKGKLAGAIGEGMSDALAVFLTLDDAIAEYAHNSTTGIRSSRFLSSARTYRNVSGYSLHLDGEIFASAMSRLLVLWVNTGRDYFALWRYVMDGMNYIPSSPAFEDMRDGILTSMMVNGTSLADRCVVWDAFAKYGIGYGADGRLVTSPTSTSTTVSITESFARAPECAGVPSTISGLTEASLKRLPRARLAGDIQTALRQRGFSSAKTAWRILPSAGGSARPALAH